jgi:ABC-type multidrug transport system ATPase subunit
MDNISLGFENLSISNDSGINILNNVSGYVVKGGVTAILGNYSL